MGVNAALCIDGIYRSLHHIKQADFFPMIPKCAAIV